MANEGILAAGGVGLVAVLALLVATVRDVDGRTGGSDWTDNLPDSGTFQFEDPEDRWSDDDFDFGGPGGSTSDGTGSSDPSGMTDPATQPWRS